MTILINENIPFSPPAQIRNKIIICAYVFQYVPWARCIDIGLPAPSVSTTTPQWWRRVNLLINRTNNVPRDQRDSFIARKIQLSRFLFNFYTPKPPPSCPGVLYETRVFRKHHPLPIPLPTPTTANYLLKTLPRPSPTEFSLKPPMP